MARSARPSPASTRSLAERDGFRFFMGRASGGESVGNAGAARPLRPRLPRPHTARLGLSPARYGPGEKKYRTPAQPVAHEGANDARALDIGYENILMKACRSYMLIRIKTLAREGALRPGSEREGKRG